MIRYSGAHAETNKTKERNQKKKKNQSCAKNENKKKIKREGRQRASGTSFHLQTDKCPIVVILQRYFVVAESISRLLLSKA